MDTVGQKVKDILTKGECLNSRFIENHDDLVEVVERLRSVGHTIAFVSGVWDLKHVGHERYLSAASKQADILVVGCDTDQLTQKKGPNRPIVTMDERVEQLINLRSVDIVTPISSYDEADKLIAELKPDVMVISESTEKNTDDHLAKMKKLHGKNCGEIVVLPPQAKTSTTARVRNLMIDGVEGLASAVTKTVNDYLHNTKKDES